MPLTRDFRITIRDRLARDPGFREAMLEGGVQCRRELAALLDELPIDRRGGAY